MLIAALAIAFDMPPASGYQHSSMHCDAANSGLLHCLAVVSACWRQLTADATYELQLSRRSCINGLSHNVVAGSYKTGGACSPLPSPSPSPAPALCRSCLSLSLLSLPSLPLPLPLPSVCCVPSVQRAVRTGCQHDPKHARSDGDCVEAAFKQSHSFPPF